MISLISDRFNPDYAKYGFGSWPGGLAHNAFNNSLLEPYTGHLDIDDYIDDLQVPQMLDIALKYDTEIMVSKPYSVYIGARNAVYELTNTFMGSGVTLEAQIKL